jgi:hypothetical protein
LLRSLCLRATRPENQAFRTNLDADHLDIYGDLEAMIIAYNEFCSKIRPGGKLLINSRIKPGSQFPKELPDSPMVQIPVRITGHLICSTFKDYYSFSLQTPVGTFKDLHFPFPGLINVENMTAAIAVALMCGVTENEIRKAMILFQGVRRRFDIRLDLPGLSQVFDDLALADRPDDDDIPSGFAGLDEFLNGLQRSDLVIIAGRPSMGKTSLALNIARNAAVEHRATVALFSLEMSRDSLVTRLVSSESGINARRIRFGEHKTEEEERKVKGCQLRKPWKRRTFPRQGRSRQRRSRRSLRPRS